MGDMGNAPPGQPAVHLAGEGNARLHFSGPPRALTGTIPLVNNSPDKQKIRTITVNADKLLGAAREPLREMPFAARLAGREQASVPATLVLDAQTPPGNYDFQLTLGDRTLPAVASVSEVVDLRLDPKSITILVGSGTSYTRTLIVENAGNVPLPTGPQCEAPIFDSFDLVSSMLIGLHKGDRQSGESMARAFLNEWADLQAGILITKRPPIIIAPGAKLSVDVEFQIPDSLKPLRHYVARLQLYNARLSIDLYTTVKAGSGATRPSATKKSKQEAPNE